MTVQHARMAKAGVLIRKPVAEIVEAFVDSAKVFQSLTKGTI
jgi:hypothetical protein